LDGLFEFARGFLEALFAVRDRGAYQRAVALAEMNARDFGPRRHRQQRGLRLLATRCIGQFRPASPLDTLEIRLRPNDERELLRISRPHHRATR
jgi:hypothetical protein